MSDPILASEFHALKTINLSPGARALLDEGVANASDSDRENTRQLFLVDVLKNAAELGQALSGCAGHLSCPACFQAFPKAVDIIALESKLREVHNHIANACVALTAASEIVTADLED